jgi:hypothetical protein
VTVPTVVTPVNTSIRTPQKIWNGGTGIAPLIVNNDPLNTLYIGSQADVLRQDTTSTIPIEPLGAQVWGDVDVWAFAPVTVNTCLIIPGGTLYQPSPAQVAISEAGLATAANQVTGNTTAATIATNTGATETAVTTVNTTLGTPAQDRTIVNPNPYFYLGSLAGWSGTHASLAIPSAPLAGCPAAYAANVTPNGLATTAEADGGVFQCNVNNLYTPKAAINLPFTDANITQVEVDIKWYSDQAGTVQVAISHNTLPVPNASSWVWLEGASVNPPATAVTGRVAVNISGSADIAATDVFQIAAITVAANIAGSPAQEGTLSSLHDRIANTGTPLIVNRQYLLNQTVATAIGVGDTVIFPSSGTIPVGQVGYDGLITISAAGATTLLVPCEIIVTWYDNGVVIDSQVYNVYAGQSTTSPHQIYIKGPTRGTAFSISFTNNSGTTSFTVQCQIFQNSRVYLFDLWRTIVGVFLAGTTALNLLGDYETSGNYVLVLPPSSVGAGDTNSYVMPLYTGKVNISAATASLTTDMQVSLSNPISPAAVQGAIINVFSNSQGFVSPITELGLPKDQLTANMHNGNAAIKNLSITIIGTDY